MNLHDMVLRSWRGFLSALKRDAAVLADALPRPKEFLRACSAL